MCWEERHQRETRGEAPGRDLILKCSRIERGQQKLHSQERNEFNLINPINLRKNDILPNLLQYERW